MKRIVIQFSVTAKEKRAIQRAAKRARMTVSQWLRRYATVEPSSVYAAGREKVRLPPDIGADIPGGGAI